MDQKTAADTITVTHALLDAKLEVVEARTDTKFAQLMGEIKLLGVNVLALGGQITDLKTDISNVKTEITGVKTATAGVKWNIMAAGLTLGGLIIALAAFGTQILDLAMSLISAK